MKRLLIALLLLAAPAWAEEPVQLARMSGPMLGAGVSAAAACELGYNGSDGTNQNFNPDLIFIERLQASCSGTLTVAHLYNRDNNDATVRICVYSGSESGSPDASNELIACSAVIYDTADAGYKDGAISLSVSAGSYYFVVVPSCGPGIWTTLRQSNTTIYYAASGGGDFCASPPATLNGSWSSAGSSGPFDLYLSE